MILGPILTILGITLGGRVGLRINGSYWTSEAITKGVWCLLRAAFSFVVGANPFIIELHPILRISEVLCILVMATFDSCSQVYFASLVECYENGICSDDHNAPLWNFLYMMRDLTSVYLESTLLISLFWASMHLGWTSNRIILPKSEHRSAAIQKEMENSLRELMQAKDYDGLQAKIKESEKIGLRSPTVEHARKMAAKGKKYS